MSRGPGRWQRILLAAFDDDYRLDSYDPYYPVLLSARMALGGDRKLTRSEQVAVRHAAKQLVLAGKARATYRMIKARDTGTAQPHLCLSRPDDECESDVAYSIDHARIPWVTDREGKTFAERLGLPLDTPAAECERENRRRYLVRRGLPVELLDAPREEYRAAVRG